MPYADKNKQREYDRIWKNARTERLRALKTGPCADCGGSFPSFCMDWDHLPGQPKFKELSKMQQYRLDRCIEEIKKCQLVCANCHRIRTYTRLHQQ